METLASYLPAFPLMRDDTDKHACQSPHPQPSPGLFSHLKRKRTDSVDSLTSINAASPSKQCRHGPAKYDAGQAAPPPSPLAVKQEVISSAPAVTGAQEQSSAPPKPQQQPSQQPPSVKPMERKPVPASSKANWGLRDKALEKVEAQINLEILFKHEELRLIEQELAKCQVALEQLRRVELVQYPGEQGTVESREHITAGTGPALEPAAGLTRPSHPAPWGVTDGPYSRHYAHWLLPDSMFDPGLPETPIHGRMSFGPEPRSARGSIAERPSFASSRSQRYAQSAKFQALPSAYHPPKDRNQPLLLKKQNGDWVKLICKWCGKDTINSVQGFLNHCRIAHQHNYVSHEQAAEDCGHPLDAGESPMSATATAAPTAVVAATAPSTPAVATPTTLLPSVAPALASRPNVHPLITGPQKSGMSSAAQSLNSSPVKPFAKSTAETSGAVKTQRAASFVPSDITPRLSSLLAKAGATCDLKKAVADAKIKCDIDLIQPLVQDEEVEDSQPQIATTNTASGVRMPRSSMSAVQPAPGMPSFSASRNFGQRLMIPNSASSSFAPGPSTADSTVPGSFVFTPNLEPGSFMHGSLPHGHAPDTPDNFRESPIDHLSPRTVDSNPGMVTDRDDDDDADMEHRFDSDHDVPMHNASSPDHVRIHVPGHDEHQGDFQTVADQPATCSVDQNQMFERQQQGIPAVAARPTLPPRKKRGRPSKKDKAAALAQIQQQQLQQQQQ